MGFMNHFWVENTCLAKLAMPRLYPDACAVFSTLSANPTFAETQEEMIIRHFISTMKNKQQRDWTKVMQPGSSRDK